MTIRRALSLSNPWPWAFLHPKSPKRIENRSRKDGRRPNMCLYRGELYLHAATSWDPQAALWMRIRGLCRSSDVDMLLDRTQHQAGGIFARTVVIGHVEPSCIVGDTRPVIVMGHQKEDATYLDDRIVWTESLRREEGPHLIRCGVDQDAVEEAKALDISWWMGPTVDQPAKHGLIFDDVHPVAFTPCKGALDLWPIPTNVRIGDHA